MTEVTPEQRAELEGMAADVERRGERAAALMAANPKLPFMTATIIAGDILGAERWREQVEAGEVEKERAVWLTGSYARLDQAMRLMPEEWVIANLPELWRGSDPDDVDPRFLELWKKAKRANGGHYIRDGRPLRRVARIAVFRGQMPGDPLGIAWTTNPKIAGKFARGAGARVSNLGGHILRGTVRREDVLAYLTGRHEDEVVIDPRLVR